MRHDLDADKQVAWDRAASSSSTMTADTQAAAGRDSLRNGEAELAPLPGNRAPAPACLALRSRHSLSAAVRARDGRRREEGKPRERRMHVPRAFAGGTGGASRTGARVFARRAILRARHLQLDLATAQLLVERDAHATTHVRRPRSARFTPRTRWRPLGGGAHVVGARRCLAIVGGTPGRIAENVVGGADEFERLLGIGAVIAIRVP